jgi:hypothetical protein
MWLREGLPKRRAGVSMNGKQRRNKQKAFTFVHISGHYFCIISSCFAERVEAFVLGRLLWFVSWRDKK